MPRDPGRGEHVDDHQLRYSPHFNGVPGYPVVERLDELAAALELARQARGDVARVDPSHALAALERPTGPHAPVPSARPAGTIELNASREQESPPSVVSVLVVNYRSTALLEKCLNSLLDCTAARQLQIIVVDNASPDFDESRLAARYPTVQFLPQSNNTTYTGGNNLAFGKATGKYILLLNPDTRVDGPAIANAIRHFDDDPRLVAQGAYLLDVDGRFQHYYRRLPRTRDVPVVLLWRQLGRTPLGRHYLMRDVDFGELTSVAQPPGAFIIVRREKCGDQLLDPGYFNFFSDVDLCDRLGANGEIAVADDVRCVHLRGGAGVGTRDPLRQLLLFQDLTWGARRYFRQRADTLGRAYLEVWLLLFWTLAAARAIAQGPTLAARALGIALDALRGRPPVYD